MKATKQTFPVVLFIVLFKVVLIFKSVDEILQCDHSNESCIIMRYEMVLPSYTVEENNLSSFN